MCNSCLLRRIQKFSILYSPWQIGLPIDFQAGELLVNKGKVLLKMAAHAMLVGLEVIPIVGAVVRIGHGWWRILQEEQERISLEERIVQLEEAAACGQEEARQLAVSAVAELTQQARRYD